jgi:hypothetical protein
MAYGVRDHQWCLPKIFRTAFQSYSKSKPEHYNMGTLASYKLASRLYRKLEYYSQLPHEDQEVYRPQLMASIQMFEEARRRYRKLSVGMIQSLTRAPG